MRKILLAGAATFAMAGVASAGELTPGLGSILGTAAPGKSTIRIDTQITVAAGFGNNSLSSALQRGADGNIYRVKSDSYGMMMYARLYPAFDAQTPGGLRYGGAAEIRANNNTGGVVGVGTAGQRNTNTLYWNRAYGYLGGDKWGILRFGMVDGPISLMNVGTFQGFADGGWNGTAPGLTIGMNPWQFVGSGGYEYSSQKFSYTTPNWYGFDFGLSFAPSTATHQGSDGSLVSVGGSARQATSILATDGARYRNMWEINSRYRGTFGGVGVAANLGYVGSGKVNVVGAGTGFGDIGNAKGLSLWDAGAQISYMGFSFGGHATGGDSNGNTNLTRSGQKDSLWWLVGAQYETGPWTIGTHYMNSTRPGNSFALTSAAQKEWGVAVGGTYAWAPGVRTFFEFVTAERKEGGTNLNIGVGPAKDKIFGTALVIGQAFRW